MLFVWMAVVFAALPLTLLALFLVVSGADIQWENHVAHFWLVLAAALVTLMPFVRTARAAQWLAKYDRRMFLLFLLIWPAYLLAAVFWSFGFMEEAISEK